MSATFGNKFKVTIFGESHGAGVGVVVDGVPAGAVIDTDYINAQMLRRAPGRKLATARKESDQVEFLSGVFNGRATGAPICMFIKNSDTKSVDYDNLRYLMRPSHSDYTAHIKYKGANDYRGGGHFSGRLTAGLVAAGSIARAMLLDMGITIGAHILQVGNVKDQPFGHEINKETLEKLSTMELPLLIEIEEKIRQTIELAQAQKDSVGGAVECAIVGVPAGVGEPFFDSVESRLAQILFSIPGVKGVSFGAADAAPSSFGSEYNDAFYKEGDRVLTKTNNSGGINGGISNGMPIVFTVKMRPTPSIAQPQHTVDINTKENATLEIKGRHDPCIAIRGVCVMEAAAAIAIYDLIK